MHKPKGWMGLFCALGILGVTARAHQPAASMDEATPVRSLFWVEPGPAETSVLYADGSEIELQSETVWRYACGSDTTGLTENDLRATAEAARAAFAEGQPTWLISPEGVRGGLNIVFSVSGGLPAGAQAALDEAALYLESQFSDPITVTISFSMFNFGNPNVIGSTGSNYAGSPDWNTTRAGLVGGMDGDDTIQDSLPTGSTIPVRYDASTATITNENRAFFTRANYNATIGSSAGSAATMQLNTGFAFDYDPSNGITPNTMCYRSVVVHETGHALGFTSRVDQQTPDINALDIYRFQRTDGTGTDWNPDDLAEFQTTARTVDFNNLNDDANSDIITGEFRMSDGNPYQASHFREQAVNIGIMDPALAFGQTFYPDYFKGSDLNMLDAIGWDRVVCAAVEFDDPPDSQSVDEGDPVAFSVAVSGAGPFTYQWRKDSADLSNGPAAGGGTIAGADTDTLTIDAAGELDEGGYDCVVTNVCGSETSAAATLSVCVPVGINDQPDDQTVDEGDRAEFSVVAGGTGPYSYRWRRNSANLSDGPSVGGGTISGATTEALTIDGVGVLDEGDYDCVVGNGCGSQTSDDGTLTVNAGVPSATVTGALSRKSCDLPVASFNGAGPVASEPRQGGVTELRISFDVAPAGPGATPVTIEEATCAAPAYAAYTGSSNPSASIAGNELVLNFTPGLENARTYRVNIGSSVTGLAGQFVEVRGLVADVNGNGLVDGGDRSVVVGVWTGAGFTCASDVSNSGLTDGGDRSIVVGAWTSAQNCAP